MARDPIKGLNEELAKIKKASLTGALKAALIVQAEAQRRVPVEYGKLRASAYSGKSPTNPNYARVGFSAAYAFYVHENMEMKWRGKPRRSGIGVYWGPKGEAKFLEKAVTAKRKDIISAISGEAKRRK